MKRIFLPILFAVVILPLTGCSIFGPPAGDAPDGDIVAGIEAGNDFTSVAAAVDYFVTVMSIEMPKITGYGKDIAVYGADEPDPHGRALRTLANELFPLLGWRLAAPSQAQFRLESRMVPADGMILWRIIIAAPEEADVVWEKTVSFADIQ